MTDIEPQNSQKTTISSDMIDHPVELPHVEKFIEETPIKKHNNIAGAVLLGLGLVITVFGLFIYNGNPDDPSGLNILAGSFVILPGLILLFLSFITAMFANKAVTQARSEHMMLAALPVEGLRYQLKIAIKKASICLALAIVAIIAIYITHVTTDTSLIVSQLNMICGLASVFFLLVSGKYFIKAIKISRRIKAS